MNDSISMAMLSDVAYFLHKPINNECSRNYRRKPDVLQGPSRLPGTSRMLTKDFIFEVK